MGGLWVCWDWGGSLGWGLLGCRVVGEVLGMGGVVGMELLGQGGLVGVRGCWGGSLGWGLR